MTTPANRADCFCGDGYLCSTCFLAQPAPPAADVAYEMQTANLIAYLQMRQDPVTKDFPNSDADILMEVHNRIGNILDGAA
jgi:hypothetical protein